MADFSGRTAAEKRLAKRLGQLGGEVYQEIADKLGDPPDLMTLTPELWNDIQLRYSGAVRPELEKIFLDALDELLDEISFSLDWDMANSAAADWARTYGYELVGGINNTSRTMVQQAVADFFDQGLSIDDLRDKLSRVFGPVRAEGIAVTEVTRAVTESGKLMQKEMEAQGVRMVPIHNTSNDERVCPICVPRDQQEIKDGRYAPLHVRCRCWTSYQVVTDAE